MGRGEFMTTRTLASGFFYVLIANGLWDTKIYEEIWDLVFTSDALTDSSELTNWIEPVYNMCIFKGLVPSLDYLTCSVPATAWGSENVSLSMWGLLYWISSGSEVWASLIKLLDGVITTSVQINISNKLHRRKNFDSRLQIRRTGEKNTIPWEI